MLSSILLLTLIVGLPVACAIAWWAIRPPKMEKFPLRGLVIAPAIPMAMVALIFVLDKLEGGLNIHGFGGTLLFFTGIAIIVTTVAEGVSVAKAVRLLKRMPVLRTTPNKLATLVGAAYIVIVAVYFGRAFLEFSGHRF